MSKIICEISSFDFTEIPTPVEWRDIVGKKLKEAGFPLDNEGNLLKGIVKRFDDPKDFSKCTYEWNGTEEEL